MIRMNINVKIILQYRRNFYSQERYKELIKKSLNKRGSNVQWEISNSIADTWFLLSKNVENLDLIHHFSSEKQVPPDTVKRYLKEKGFESILKYHYTGSSIKGYESKVQFVLNAVMREIRDDQLYLEESKITQTPQI